MTPLKTGESKKTDRVNWTRRSLAKSYFFFKQSDDPTIETKAADVHADVSVFTVPKANALP